MDPKLTPAEVLLGHLGSSESLGMLKTRRDLGLIPKDPDLVSTFVHN
jgi:hypothetical protein